MLTMSSLPPSHQNHRRLLPGTISAQLSDSGGKRIVAFTTPANYAERLRHLIHLQGWRPLWCPTVVVEHNHRTAASISRFLSPHGGEGDGTSASPLEEFSAVAFTSRTAITAFSEFLHAVHSPPLAPAGGAITLAALGRDSELLDEGFLSRICRNKERIRVVVPPVATPAALADSLGPGGGRRVLCPVPLVVDLAEPPVVPDFLRRLTAGGWAAVRVTAYETRWAGPRCAEWVVRGGEWRGLDGVVLTSTGEVEGLLKGLGELGLDWAAVRRRFPGMVVAAHGPVTAAGAERLGVAVDVVSCRFDSFEGVVEALARRWHGDGLNLF